MIFQVTIVFVLRIFLAAAWGSVLTLDLSAADSDLKGFMGGFSDGTYGYVVPHKNSFNSWSGKVARFDERDFSRVYVSMLDFSLVDPDLTGGFVGGFADKTYGYLVPSMHSSYFGKVARFSLATFSIADVAVLNLADVSLKGFRGGFSDGIYGYLVPHKTAALQYSGKVARFTLATFSNVAVLDLTLTDPTLTGFDGGFSADSYGYLVPWRSSTFAGKVVRFSLLTFTTADVAVLDLTSTDALLEGFRGGFTDGRYGYLVPHAHSKVGRFSLKNFSDIASLNLASIDSELTGFCGGDHDNKYGYLMPQAFGKLVRFRLDTFTGVEVIDLKATANLHGFGGGFISEFFGYLVPNRLDTSATDLAKLVDGVCATPDGSALAGLRKRQSCLLGECLATCQNASLCFSVTYSPTGYNRPMGTIAGRMGECRLHTLKVVSIADLQSLLGRNDWDQVPSSAVLRGVSSDGHRYCRSGCYPNRTYQKVMTDHWGRVINDYQCWTKPDGFSGNVVRFSRVKITTTTAPTNISRVNSNASAPVNSVVVEGEADGVAASFLIGLTLLAAFLIFICAVAVLKSPTVQDYFPELYRALLFLLGCRCCKLSFRCCWPFAQATHRSGHATSRLTRRAASPKARRAASMKEWDLSGKRAAEILDDLPPALSENCRSSLQHLITEVTDHPEFAEVFILGSLSRRELDVERSGPGLFFAAAVARALFDVGISCYTSLPELAGGDVGLKLLASSDTNCRVVVVLETSALYACSACLKQIYIARMAAIEIIRLRFEPITRSNISRLLQVPVGDHDMQAVAQFVATLFRDEEGVEPATGELVQFHPDFLNTFAVKMLQKARANGFYIKSGNQIGKTHAHEDGVGLLEYEVLQSPSPIREVWSPHGDRGKGKGKSTRRRSREGWRAVPFESESEGGNSKSPRDVATDDTVMNASSVSHATTTHKQLLPPIAFGQATSDASTYVSSSPSLYGPATSSLNPSHSYLTPPVGYGQDVNESYTSAGSVSPRHNASTTTQNRLSPRGKGKGRANAKSTRSGKKSGVGAPKSTKSGAGARDESAPASAKPQMLEELGPQMSHSMQYSPRTSPRWSPRANSPRDLNPRMDSVRSATPRNLSSRVNSVRSAAVPQDRQHSPRISPRLSPRAKNLKANSVRAGTPSSKHSVPSALPPPVAESLAGDSV